MSKHTPGPWECVWSEDDGHVIRMSSALGGANGYESHHCIEYQHGLYPDDGDQFKEAKANARLIAAAPDLLAALKALLSFHQVRWVQDEGPDGEGWKSTELTAAFDAADAAIAKAEGQ